MSESTLKDFARRVERDVTEAVRLLGWAHKEAAKCGRHVLEPGEGGLNILESLERDARAISIREEARKP